MCVSLPWWDLIQSSRQVFAAIAINVQAVCSTAFGIWFSMYFQVATIVPLMFNPSVIEYVDLLKKEYVPCNLALHHDFTS
jgi:hypothetical protein